MMLEPSRFGTSPAGRLPSSTGEGNVTDLGASGRHAKGRTPAASGAAKSLARGPSRDSQGPPGLLCLLFHRIAHRGGSRDAEAGAAAGRGRGAAGPARLLPLLDFLDLAIECCHYVRVH